VDNSWLAELEADPLGPAHAPNRSPRGVAAGHYVHVEPTPLADPVLVAYSDAVAFGLLGLAPADVASAQFLRTFSGDNSGGLFGASWATPYALSIYGHPHLPAGAQPDGSGYGDGRAVSVAEVVVPAPWAPHGGTDRFELQLKGGGRTPFCRGGDGRAVLRSSVHRFLSMQPKKL
jgi:uncharacterized protein YdiU (UPF0061 family)